MKPKLYLSAVIVAVVLAIPITSALAKQNKQIKIEKTQNLQYQLRIEKLKDRSAEQKKTIEEIDAANQTKDAENQQLKDKNADLEKQLQSKRQAQSTLAVASTGNCASYSGLVAQYNWDQHVAMAVMRAESGCNPSAASPSCDSGLMQINCVHSAKVNGNLAALKDPATNIRVAYQIYSAQGWNPWVAFTSGSYRKFL